MDEEDIRVMCGIIGYCGNNAASVILEGLKRMEYRGYDSSGVATICDKKLLIKKDVGNLEQVSKSQEFSNMLGNIGIGHTRWATHGGVTQLNAHPHCDCVNEIAIVHNGIIDNYQELRKELIDNGHKFISETDSEVISHLLEEELKKDCTLEYAVRNVGNTLKGSYAFLAIATKFPNKIVGTRNGSPLLIGSGKNGDFFASDAAALMDATHVVILGDWELASIENARVTWFNSSGEEIYKKYNSIQAIANDYDKNNYDFYMLKEIMEQPKSIVSSLLQEKDRFTSIALDILKARHVIIAASGSSRYAALVGRYMFSSVGKTFCEVVMGSEFQYFANSVDRSTVVLAISQSGETMDVIDGIKLARQAGAKIISIVNRQHSMLEDLSHETIHLNCGPEIGVAATKSFLNQLSIFYLLASSMSNSFDVAMNDMREMSGHILDVIESNSNEIDRIVEKFHNTKDIYFIARGINFAIASEAALKLKEISYIHAEGMPAGELKHGTLSLIENGTPVVVICPNDFTYSDTLSNAMEAKARGAKIIAVSDISNEIYDYWIKIPTVMPLLYPFVAIVPLQLLAYRMAIKLGRNPDMPRNLAKSVTVK